MKSLLTILALSLFSHLAFGQDSLAVSDNDKQQAIVGRLRRELNLDDTQTQKVDVIIKKRFNVIAKARHAGQETNRSEANQKTVDNLKQVLSPEQFALYLKLRKQSQNERETFLSQNPSYKFSEDDKDMDI